MGRQEAIGTYFNAYCLSHTRVERLSKAIKIPKRRQAGFETSITGNTILEDSHHTKSFGEK